MLLLLKTTWSSGYANEWIQRPNEQEKIKRALTVLKLNPLSSSEEQVNITITADGRWKVSSNNPIFNVADLRRIINAQPSEPVAAASAASSATAQQFFSSAPSEERSRGRKIRDKINAIFHKQHAPR